MKLEELIEMLRAHRSSPEECARQLAQGAGGLTEAEALRGFRTALAVAALDLAFGRRLAEALERLAGAPADSASSPELDALEAEVREFEHRHEGARAEAAEAQRLQEQIERSTAALAELTTGIEKAAADVAAARSRCETQRALLAEVGRG
jgi:DNA repair exonuclease SbcCD ATPase subunit